MCEKQANFHLKKDCASRWESTKSHHLKNCQISLKIPHGWKVLINFSVVSRWFNHSLYKVMLIDLRFEKFQFLANPFVNQIMTFSTSVDFRGLLGKYFDIQSSFGVFKVQVESNDVSKTGTWSKIHWTNAEIFTLFWRKSCKITIFEQIRKNLKISICHLSLKTPNLHSNPTSSNNSHKISCITSHSRCFLIK